MSPDPVSPAPGSRRWCEECGPEPGVAYHEPCGGRGCDGCDNSGTVTCTCLKAAPGSPPSREDLLAALSDAQFSTPYWMKVTHGRLRWLRDQLPALLDAQAALADAREECEELQRHRTVHVDENRSLRATVAELQAALADAKKRIERFETYCEVPEPRPPQRPVRPVSEPPVLADLMALKIDGPVLVFVRPRYPLSLDGLLAARDALNRLPLDDKFGKFVLVPSDFDIMAVGDVELARYGLARLPTASKDPPDDGD